MKLAKQILLALAAAAEGVAILDWKGAIDVLPPGWAPKVAGFVTLAAFASHFLKVIEQALAKAETPNNTGPK